MGSDGSATATEAVRRAASMAVAFGARLTIACAYSLPGSGSPAVGGGVLGQLAGTAVAPPSGEPPADLRWRVTRAAEAEELARRAAEVAESLGCHDVATVAVPGDPAAALVALASSLSADLLVVGSKGMQSWTRFVLGSVPNAISHHAPCDVLIVRTDR
ncbi:MAG: universal stress protein [Actinomycetota bacterium]|nr:universal stress protein [Actinomycetota bacterium]